jgi:hypothetical protein
MPAAPRAANTASKVVKPETILIHFVEDGLTAFGYSWLAGQELEVGKDSPEFERTKDIHGKSWLELTEEEQEAQWGKVKFKTGPSTIPNPIVNYKVSPNERFDYRGVSNMHGLSISRDYLEAEAKKELERGRGVPK